MSVMMPGLAGLSLVPPPYPIWKVTVDQYHRMIETGTLTEDDPVELLEGWIVPKMPRNPPHDGTIDMAEEVVRGRLPPGWRLRNQCAITLPDSEPEPDLVIVRGQARLPNPPSLSAGHWGTAGNRQLFPGPRPR